MQVLSFAGWQPSGRSKRGYPDAKAEYYKRTGKPFNPDVNQIHHISWERQNGKPSNLIAADNQEEHTKWHHQIMKFVIDSFRAGLLKFSRESRSYYTDDDYIISKLHRKRRFAA